MSECIRKAVPISAPTKASVNHISPLKTKEQRFETFQFVWLDPNVDTNKENQATQKHLRQILIDLLTFHDCDECEQWLKNYRAEEKIILIVSGRFGRQIVPRIHDLPSIIAIFVYCLKRKLHEVWAQNYRKVRSIVTLTDDLVQKLSRNQRDLESIEDSKAIEIFEDHHRTCGHDPRNASFLWYQLLLELLISSSYFSSPSTPAELIQALRQYSSEHKHDPNWIKEFEETYEAKQAVSWLIRDTPLVRFINKALREQDINLLFLLRFFLADIHAQLTAHPTCSLHSYKLHPMPLLQIEYIQANPNHYLCLSGFLFTSTKKLEPESIIPNNNQFETVLFDIDASLLEDAYPFACVREMDATIENQIDRQVLFMCGSVFRIHSFTRNHSSNWTLRLALAGKKYLDLLANTKRDLLQSGNLCIIGDLLNECDQYEKATVYYQCLLRELPSHHALVPQINEKLSKNSKTESMSLSTVQFVLVDLSTRLSQSALAMLNVLRSLTDDSMLIFDDGTNVDFHQLPDKTTLLFASSQFVSSLRWKPQQIRSIFTLENNKDKIDQRERFATGEDLICQLADEIYRYYKREASEHAKLDDPTIADGKEKQANRIHSELRKAHQMSITHENESKSTTCTTTALVWLKFKARTDFNVEQVQKEFSEIVSFYSTFTNEHDCHNYLVSNEKTNTVFLIVDTDYEDGVVAGSQHWPNVKCLYQYGQSTSKSETIITKSDALRLQLTHDLIDHYSELGAEFRAKKDVKLARNMFLKAQQLCELLARL